LIGPGQSARVRLLVIATLCWSSEKGFQPSGAFELLMNIQNDDKEGDYSTRKSENHFVSFAINFNFNFLEENVNIYPAFELAIEENKKPNFSSLKMAITQPGVSILCSCYKNK